MLKYIFLLVILFVSNLTSFSQDKYKITADKLNVRESNDPKSKIIGYIPQNEIVEVIDNSDPKFIKVRVRNGQGWVSREFAVLVQKSTSNNQPLKQNSNNQPTNDGQLNKPDSLINNKIETPTSNQTISQEADSTQWTFIILIVIIIGVLTYIIFKYIQSKTYKIISLLAILLFSYSIYQGFIVEKTVGGKYLSLANHQFASFEFKPNGSVLIYDQYLDTTYSSTYKIQGSKVLFKQDENLFIMIIKDQNTLLGDGFLKGQYIK